MARMVVVPILQIRCPPNFALFTISITSCVGNQQTTQVVINNNNINVNNLQQRPNTLTNTSSLIRGAESGKRQIINHYLTSNPDCSSNGYPNVKVTTPPEHGVVSIENGEGFPGFPKENVRSACNAKKLPAIVVYYTSQAGYAGTDKLSVECIFPEGGFTHIDYTVNVR